MSENIKQKTEKKVGMIIILCLIFSFGLLSLDTKADLIFQEIREWQIASDDLEHNYCDDASDFGVLVTVDDYTQAHGVPDTTDATSTTPFEADADYWTFNMADTALGSFTSARIGLTFWDVGPTHSNDWFDVQYSINAGGAWNGLVQYNSGLLLPTSRTLVWWDASLITTAAEANSTQVRIILDKQQADDDVNLGVDGVEMEITYTGNNLPTLENISLNAGSNFAPSPGTVVDVTISGKAVDDDGCSGLGGYEGQAYVSAQGINCAASNSNCYVDISCNTSCSGSVANVSCPSSIWFYAEATDDLATQSWVGAILVTDAASATAETTDEANEEVEMTGALCVSVIPASIAYGIIFAGQDSGATPQSALVQNLCNTALDISVSGTNMTTAAENYTIIVTSQHYATETFTYNAVGSATEVSLLTGAANLEINALKPTTSPTDSSDEVFWGIAAPVAASDATDYGGLNTFTAIND